MDCPRCSFRLPKGTLVCVRCGARAPKPVVRSIETRPPQDGPRQAPRRGREATVEPRREGPKGANGPQRSRSSAPAWDRQPATSAESVTIPGRFIGSVAPVAAPALPAVPKVSSAKRLEALPSGVFHAKTEPAFQPLPRDIEDLESTVDAGDADDGLLAAPLSTRAAAFLVDQLVIGGVTVAALLVGATAFGWERIRPALERGPDHVVDALFFRHQLGLVTLSLGLCLGFAYTTLSHALAGATPGKRLFGMKVVDGQGKRPNLRDAAARSLALFVGVTLAGLGVAFALFDRRHRTLHDRLVGTRVLMDDPAVDARI
jgi:uncharacterized RDD family membrane protein YckC